MDSAVSALATNEPVVPVGKLQRDIHLKIRQPPVAVCVVEIVRAVLQKYADRFPFRLADQRRVNVTAADVGEAADVAEHFAELVRTFPRDREGTNAAG